MLGNLWLFITVALVILSLIMRQTPLLMVAFLFSAEKYSIILKIGMIVIWKSELWKNFQNKGN